MKYKIEVIEIEEYEVPETQYTKTEKKNKNDDYIYEYVKTGRMLKEKKESTVFSQIKSELNIDELAVFLNN